MEKVLVRGVEWMGMGEEKGSGDGVEKYSCRWNS